MLDTKGLWSLIAHGGAKDISTDEEADNRKGLEEATLTGSKILANGGTALEAVEAVVKELELNPSYNAGLYGSVKNEAGELEMDASIMDGNNLRIGAVAGLRDVLHPVMAARALLEEKAILLAGEGAMKYAREKNLVDESKSHQQYQGKDPGCDTVGCVAMDQYGSLAVATSTGGLEGTKVGRIGDSPIPGCGFYADTTRGAVSTSGDGEAIARVLLASELIHMLKIKQPDDAIKSVLELMDKVGGEAGLIVINAQGDIGWDHTSANFAVGLMKNDMIEPKVFLKKEEEKKCLNLLSPIQKAHLLSLVVTKIERANA